MLTTRMKLFYKVFLGKISPKILGAVFTSVVQQQPSKIIRGCQTVIQIHLLVFYLPPPAHRLISLKNVC